MRPSNCSPCCGGTKGLADAGHYYRLQQLYQQAYREHRGCDKSLEETEFAAEPFGTLKWEQEPSVLVLTNTRRSYSWPPSAEALQSAFSLSFWITQDGG